MYRKTRKLSLAIMMYGITMMMAAAPSYADVTTVRSPPPASATEIDPVDQCNRKHKPFIYEQTNINPLVNAVPTFPPSICHYCCLLDAARNGNLLWWFRFRNEEIHQEGFKDAYANTIATHLGYQTANFYHFSGLLEFNNTTIIGHQHYNSGDFTSPGLRRYATTNDPRGTRVDQVYIEYDDFYKTDFKGGRQRIHLDNERYIGAAFRQMEEVYDGVSFFNTAIPNFNLFYAWIGRVNRVWGPKGVGPFSNNSTNINLLNIRYDIWDIGSIVGYGYFIDNEDVPSFSTSTGGVRFNGSRPCRNVNFLYTAEYAHQENQRNNPVHYRANYYHLAGGIQFKTDIAALEFDLQREKLGGQRHRVGGSFITPLASFHSFQGWAELFNNTPRRGVIDSVASASATIHPLWDIRFLAYYHYFQASAGNQRTYGTEVDAEIGKKFKYVDVFIDYAKFMSKDKSFPRTQRIWVVVQSIPFM